MSHLMMCLTMGLLINHLIDWGMCGKTMITYNLKPLGVNFTQQQI